MINYVQNALIIFMIEFIGNTPKKKGVFGGRKYASIWVNTENNNNKARADSLVVRHVLD